MVKVWHYSLAYTVGIKKNDRHGPRGAGGGLGWLDRAVTFPKCQQAYQQSHISFSGLAQGSMVRQPAPKLYYRAVQLCWAVVLTLMVSVNGHRWMDCWMGGWIRVLYHFWKRICLTDIKPTQLWERMIGTHPKHIPSAWARGWNQT